MPSTPRVNFNFINKNVDESSPLQGISTVIARTTKGPALDPSQLTTSISQFKRVYGSEIVPDGSVSNIERALIGGSKLRIIRVMGEGSARGNLGELFQIDIQGKIYSVNLETRGFGDPIGTGTNITVTTEKQGNTVYYSVLDENQSVLESGPVFSYLSADHENPVNLTSIDYLALSSWINTNPYFKVSVVETIPGTDQPDQVHNVSIEEFLTVLAENDNTKNKITVTLQDAARGTIGSAGGNPTKDQWLEAVEYVKDYTDSYNILASHVSSHLETNDAIAVYKKLKEICDELNEFRLFIEIPKFKSGSTDPRNVDDIIDWKNTCANTIGHSKWVSYYAAGLVYNNIFGIAQGSDVGGTVLGLADASASNYGYDKSFAGLNRGVASDAQGTVSPNYGSHARFDQLEKLAQANINVFVVRDTPSFGKRTVLWHNFTDQVKQDSFRFLGNTGLVLNVKKTLRPILESFIEEPNIWGTWHDIYLRVRPYIDAWVDAEAMTDPEWNGDQDANSWEDLKVNTEEACRQGHYKVVFSFKDVVALQDITVDVVIEKASKSVDINVVDNS